MWKTSVFYSPFYGGKLRNLRLRAGDSAHLQLTGNVVVKNPPANAGDGGSIPQSRRSPGEGNGTPLQYSCLGNPMDRGA